MLASLLSLLVPPRCLACAGPAGPGERLCGACRVDLRWLLDACARCGLPRPCGPSCPAANAAFGAAWSPLAFEGPARALVHALKFRGRTAAAEVMAAQIAANAPAELLHGVAALIPVPADPARRRIRGFDHARLLARALARRTDLPLADALVAGAKERQVGRSAAERRRSAPPVAARGRMDGTLALVDDVHTTGATLDACARVLRACGASRVVALTYARTLG